jgi:hypothetical protein
MCRNQAAALTAEGTQQGNTCVLHPVTVVLQNQPGVRGQKLQEIRWRARSFADTPQTGPAWSTENGRSYVIRGWGTTGASGEIHFAMCADEEISLEIRDDAGNTQITLFVTLTPADAPATSVNTLRSAHFMLQELGYEPGGDPGASVGAGTMTHLLRYELDTEAVVRDVPSGSGDHTANIASEYGVRVAAGVPLVDSVYNRLRGHAEE